MKKVILTALNGVLFTPAVDKATGTPKLDKKGQPYGYLRVQNPNEISLGFAYSNGGVKQGNSALVAMTVAAWDKVKSNYKAGMELPGNVRVIESLEKKHNGFKPKMAGSGENAQACTLGGQQIYRTTEFDPTGELSDELIAHDNVIAGSNATVTSSSDAINP